MKCGKDILGIGIDKQLDPDRSQLRRVLETQFAYERMSAARSMLVHLLAFLGVVVWVTAISPDLFPKEARLFTVILWGSFLFLTIWVAVEEYLLSRKLTRLSDAERGSIVTKS
jgi:hypothetical protein